MFFFEDFARPMSASSEMATFAFTSLYLAAFLSSFCCEIYGFEKELYHRIICVFQDGSNIYLHRTRDGISVEFFGQVIENLYHKVAVLL